MNDPSYKMPAYQPIFALTRGEVVESIHYGAVAVVDEQGRLVAWHGDAQAVTYLRSSAKPFQVLPLLEHGGGEVYGFTAQEVALMCASHSGTDEHVAVLQSIQAKTGVREAELLCGTHPLGHKSTIEAMRARGATVTPNRHNCSGKHTGMLAYARLRGGLMMLAALTIYTPCSSKLETGSSWAVQTSRNPPKQAPLKPGEDRLTIPSKDGWIEEGTARPIWSLPPTADGSPRSV